MISYFKDLVSFFVFNDYFTSIQVFLIENPLFSDGRKLGCFTESTEINHSELQLDVLIRNFLNIQVLHFYNMF